MKKWICLLMLVLMIFTIFTLAGCNPAKGEQGHSHDHTHAVETEGSTDTTASQGVQTQSDSADVQGSVPSVNNTDASAENSEDSTRNSQTSAEISESSSEHNHQSQEDTQLSEYPFTVEATGTLMQKHSYKIDIPFEQEYIKAETDAQRAAVCVTYTEKWSTIAQRYYKEILYYNGSVPEDPNFTTDEEMHSYIEQRKADWEAEYKENHEQYLESMKRQYGDSDKAQAMCESYKFDLQREFSLELIGLYELLGEFNNQEF